MDYIGVAVVLLAVSSEHVELSLQNGAPCSHMGYGQRREGRPGVSCRIVHLTGQPVSGSPSLICRDSACDIKAFAQGLHAVMGSWFNHVRQVSASCLGVIHEQGCETLVVAAQPS